MKVAASHLAHLESSGLIQLAEAEPDLAYLFRHALVQDSAYASLLVQDRIALHRAAGETLERLYADQLTEFAPVLGRHFSQAGDDARALPYFIMAGDSAAQMYANREASDHYAEVLTIIRQDYKHLKAEDLEQFFARYGRTLELSGRYDEALTLYQEMHTLAVSQNNQSLELAALVALATVHAVPTAKYDPLQSESFAQQALVLARKLEDCAAEAKILWSLMLVNLFAGNVEIAVDYGEASLAIARNLDLREQLAYTLNDLQRGYLGSGDFKKSKEALQEASQLWEEIGNKPMQADSLGNSVILHYILGEPEEGLATSDQGYQISQSIGNRWGQAHNLAMVGNIYWELGNPTLAIKKMDECLDLAEQVGFITPQVATRAGLAWVYGNLGQIEQGFALAQLASDCAEASLPSWLSWPMTIKARLHIMKGQFEEAEKIVARYPNALEELNGSLAPFLVTFTRSELDLHRHRYAAGIARLNEFLSLVGNLGARVFRKDVLYLKGCLLLRQQNLDEAARTLNASYQESKALKARYLLWQILFELGQVELLQNQLDTAHNYFEEARSVINNIALNIEDPNLRASFLGLPNVQAVLYSPV
ncbi:MAG: hypothetical protein AAF485_19595 [Chloroflexota bacterium]